MANASPSTPLPDPGPEDLLARSNLGLDTYPLGLSIPRFPRRRDPRKRPEDFHLQGALYFVGHAQDVAEYAQYLNKVGLWNEELHQLFVHTHVFHIWDSAPTESQCMAVTFALRCNNLVLDYVKRKNAPSKPPARKRSANFTELLRQPKRYLKSCPRDENRAVVIKLFVSGLDALTELKEAASSVRTKIRRVKEWLLSL